MRAGSDRTAGVVLVLLGAAVAGAAAAFRVGFAADPLGPRALPLVAAGLLAAGGVALTARPGRPWAPTAPPARRRLLLALVAFLVYVPLLGAAGFLVATTLLVAALGRLFGGRTLPTLVAGAVVAAALQILFAAGLGLALPAGALWTGLLAAGGGS